MFGGFLRQSTAVTVKTPKFRSTTDLSASTGLTIQKADVRLSKNGGNMAAASADQGSSDAGMPHDELGAYDMSLNTTDTNTLGILKADIDETGAVPVEMVWVVITANAWDSLCASDLLQVDLQQWIGTAPLALTSQRVEVLVGAMANNVMTAAAAASDLTTELQNGLATAAALTAVDDFVDTEIASIISTLSTIAGYLDTEVAAILAAVDTEVSAIKAVTDALPDAGALTSLATAAALNAVDDLLDTEVAAIKTVVDAVKAKTDNLPSDPADQSLIIAATDAIKADTAAILEDTGTTLPATLATADGKLDTIDNFLDTEMAATLAAVDTEVAAIKAKTDNLPSDPADQSAVEVAIAAAQAVITALLPSALTAGGNMKSDALAINGSTAAAIRQALAAGTIIPGTVDSTGFSPTTTQFEADDITEATADHYNGRVIIFTSGALLGQATSISDYSLASGRGHFTVPALTEAPANNGTFIIV